MEKSLQGYVIGVLRRGWSRSISRRMCLEAAKRVFFKGAARRVEFKCACCGDWFNRKGVQIDHITPVIAMGGFDSWEGVIERMYCPPSQLQCLCTSCHAKKSKEEAGVRAVKRREKKANAK